MSNILLVQKFDLNFGKIFLSKHKKTVLLHLIFMGFYATNNLFLPKSPKSTFISVQSFYDLKS